MVTEKVTSYTCAFLFPTTRKDTMKESSRSPTNHKQKLCPFCGHPLIKQTCHYCGHRRQTETPKPNKKMKRGERHWI